MEVPDSNFFEESGVHVSTIETLLKEHSNDLGGISVTRADRLHTLTGILTVFPVDLKETTLGQTAKSPDKEVSTCCVTAVSDSDVFLAIPCIVLTSFGAMRIAKIFAVLTGIFSSHKQSKVDCHSCGISEEVVFSLQRFMTFVPVITGTLSYTLCLI